MALCVFQLKKAWMRGGCRAGHVPVDVWQQSLFLLCTQNTSVSHINQPPRKMISTQTTCAQCYGSMKFWYGSRSGSADPYLWLIDPDADPDPSIFVSDLQDINKIFCLLFFLKVHLHHFSKVKSQRRGGPKVRLIDLSIPIRSSDCIGRYNRLMSSSDFWIGQLCRFVLGSDSLIVRSCFLVLSSDFWIGRLCRFVLSSDSLIVRSCFLVLSSDFCIVRLCRPVLSKKIAVQAKMDKISFFCWAIFLATVVRFTDVFFFCL